MPEEAGRPREEDQSEKRPEDRPRVRGQEGQRPLIPNKVNVAPRKARWLNPKRPDLGGMHQGQKSMSLFSPQPSFDHSRDKTSPEKEATSPSSLPGDESTGEQRSFPPAQLTIQEEGGPARKSPPASATPGIEALNPASQGTVTPPPAHLHAQSCVSLAWGLKWYLNVKVEPFSKLFETCMLQHHMFLAWELLRININWQTVTED